MSDGMRASSREQDRRRQVEEAVHSGEMEGLHVTEDTSRDAGEYVAGRIDAATLRERVRARYGIV